MFIQIIRSDWLPESLFLIIFAPNDSVLFLCFLSLFFFSIQKPKRSTKCGVIGVKDLKTMFSVVNLVADRIPEKNITLLYCILGTTICKLTSFGYNFANEYSCRQKKKD